MSLTQQFYQSINNSRMKANPLFFELQEFYSEFESIQILRKYQIGTSTDGHTAFWFFDERGEPQSVISNNVPYFGLPKIWNLPLLIGNEPYSKIGFCSTPVEAFWANIYLRQEALWIYAGPGADLQPFAGLECVAILSPKELVIKNKIKQVFPYCIITEVEDLVPILKKTGVPRQFVKPPKCRNTSLPSQKMEKILDNEHVKELIEKFGLEII